MMFKMMATIAAVGMAAGATGGCSAVTPGAQGAYGSSARATAGRAAFVGTSPAVQVPGERVVGADPDPNVRFDLNRNAYFHLHGGGNGSDGQ